MYNTIIIGAGISGIFVLKHLIENNIRNVLVIDKNKFPFGVWDKRNHPGIFEETYCVSSRLYMTISDFPLTNTDAEFPNGEHITKYYNDYLKNFNLVKYLHMNEDVLKVNKINKNIWYIKTNKNFYKCKNLVIATGTTNRCLNFPKDNIFKKFSGKMYHCDEFKKIRNKLKNKKILIIGGSDYASDISELLKNSNELTLSVRNGVWFQNRTLGAYEAADMFYSRYVDFFVKNILGKKYFHDNVGEDDVFNMWGKGGHGIDDWKPKCDYLNSYYVKSREIINSISKGLIDPKGKIINIKNNRVKFIDNDIKEFDVILFCTGYDALNCNKFLDDKYIKNRYKHIFSINDNNIFFVGFIRPYLTSIPMISELQSRWISDVIAKKVKLPSKTTMISIDKKDKENQKKEFPCSYKRIGGIVDPYDYCNMIGKNIGANKNLFLLFLTDINLWYKVLFDSWNHHYFRLNDKDKKKILIAKKNINMIHKNKIEDKLKKKYIKGIVYKIERVLIYIILPIFLITIIMLVYVLLKYLFKIKLKI